MVDLDQVEEDDAKCVGEVVERHHAETGSAMAARLLADWDPGRFTKVMPKDYKRVLSAASQAEREARDSDDGGIARARARGARHRRGRHGRGARIRGASHG